MRRALLVLTAVTLWLGGCNKQQAPKEEPPPVSTQPSTTEAGPQSTTNQYDYMKGKSDSQYF